jgi:hypothetical protein
MKKLFLSAAAVMLTLAAAAQNKAIDELVEKYTDCEGFTVVNMEGEAVRGLSQMLAGGNTTFNLPDGAGSYELGELMKEIVSITAVVLRRADEAFSRDVRDALASVRYSPIVSHNENGQRVRISGTDINRGKLRGNKEIVVMVDGPDETVLVRVIGNIDTKLLAEMAREMKKSDVL